MRMCLHIVYVNVYIMIHGIIAPVLPHLDVKTLPGPYIKMILSTLGEDLNIMLSSLFFIKVLLYI